MTYVVGLSYRNMNSIIADSRQSWVSGGGRRRDGDNHVMKTGSLLPGCIFGRAGNPRASRDFILSARQALAAQPDDTISGFWNRFVRFSDQYQFPTSSGDHFQILLSTRAFGHPQFFLVDSGTGLTAVHNPEIVGDGAVITIGSGKDVLDGPLTGDFGGRLSLLQEYASRRPDAKGFLQELAPYALALWLNERSTSYERVSLEEEYGVGGLFHFLGQAREQEFRQKPALYLMTAGSGPPTEELGFWLYRVCFVRNWLFVQWNSTDGGGEQKEAYIDDCALPPLPDGREHDLDDLYRDLRDNLEAELTAQPFYFFCGVGFTDAAARRSMLFHVTTQNDHLIDAEGPGGTIRMRAELVEMIRENFRQ